eukprot:m.242715 g.242715  ORF g.242715 m.242715 type:complete len:198 (+) comp54446_c0_seq1:164-757(+)
MKQDSGFAWVVCAAFFLTNFFCSGQVFNFASFYDELMATFDTSRTTTAWVGSIALAVFSGGGMLAGRLIERFGNFKIAVMGTVFYLAGQGLSAVAPNIWYMFVSYGIFFGFSCTCIFLSGLGTIAHCFVKHKSLAIGIGFSGGGIGTFVLAPLTKTLIDQTSSQLSCLPCFSRLFVRVFSGFTPNLGSCRLALHDAD